MWEVLFNILKIGGAAGGIAAAVMLFAKVWSGAAKDQLIVVLKDELEISRAGKKAADETVQHYRDEMHEVRNDCGDKIAKSLLAENAMKESLKQVEIQNAELRTKTDLTPVMKVMTEFVQDNREFIKEQTEINSKVLAALTVLSTNSQRQRRK